MRGALAAHVQVAGGQPEPSFCIQAQEAHYSGQPPQLLTQGGPNGASRPMVLYIYQTGFNHWDVGYAAAASQILFLLILAAAMMPQLLHRLRRRPA